VASIMALPDAATLADLEYLSPASATGSSVLALMDRTLSRVGRMRLTERLSMLHDTSERILDVQSAHQELGAHAAEYRHLLEQADLDRVTRFLDSNWRLPSSMSAVGRLATRLWRARWFRDYERDLHDGYTHVTAMLAAARGLSEALLAAGSPALQSLAQELAHALAEPAIRPLTVRGRLTTARLMEFDQAARGTGKDAVKRLVHLVGTAEAMWSLGVSAAEHGWHYPRPGRTLRFVGLRHPFLDRGDAAANDLELSDAVRVCFLTGPNMAGKSTFLKAVAIAMLLAHAGCAVPADAMEFPVVACVFSSGQPHDDLHRGESLYLAEVRRMGSMAKALRASGSMFAVIDEPFRGTNLLDAQEATLAVITRLAGHPAALVFVASHLVELVSSLTDDPRIRLLHFAADMSGGEPHFDFLLRDGVSTQRLGMTLLRREGVLEVLDDAARTCERPGIPGPF